MFLCQEWGLWQDCVIVSPTRFSVLVYFFSICSICRVIQLVSGFLSEGIVLCVAVDSLHSWEEVSSGACSDTIFNWSTISNLNVIGDNCIF